MKVVSAAQMRELERRADEVGRPPAVLMENAGLAVAQEMRRWLGTVGGRQVVVLVGPGNNGGDGLVVARHLHDWGARAHLYIWNRRLEGDPNFDRTRRRNIPYTLQSDDPDSRRLSALISGSAAVVDSLLGTGKARPIEGALLGLLATVRTALSQPQVRRPGLLALDLPTGLNPDTGEVDPATVPADLTVTLGFPKLGLYRFPGADYVGQLVVADIGIPTELAHDVPTDVATADWVGSLLPARPRSAHKGTFGRALTIAGSANYVGAAFLAGAAATRVGAGLVTMAVPRSLHPILATRLTETTFLPLPEDDAGAIAAQAVGTVLQSLSGYDALLVGPGLGRHPSTLDFLRGLLDGLSGSVHEEGSGELLGLVVDADGLNLLAQIPGWWEKLGREVVMTPHPGEMSRLLGMSVRDVEADRLMTARQSAMRWNKTVLLKGAFTVVANPEGEVSINPFALAGLASAGTGDVLAGALLGFLCQGLSAFHAAVAAAYVHARAGQMVAEELGSAGLVAGDLLPVLPRAIKGLRQP